MRGKLHSAFAVIAGVALVAIAYLLVFSESDWPGATDQAKPASGTSACADTTMARGSTAPGAAAPGAAAPGARAPGQTVALPNDRSQWDLVFSLHRDWQTRPQERNLVGWFASDPDLQKLKAETKVFYFYPDSPEVRRGTYPVSAWPTVVLQTPDGRRFFKVSGNNPNWPSSGRELAMDIGAQLDTLGRTSQARVQTVSAPSRLGILKKRRCDNEPCPPTPDDTKPPTPNPEQPADTVAAPPKPNNLVGIVAAAFVVALVGFGLMGFAQRVNGVKS